MSSRQELPWDFLSGTYQLTNKAADDIVAESDPIPPGMIGVMVDSAIIFTTSGGSVHLRLKRRAGGNVRFTNNFSSTATGLQQLAMAGDIIQCVLASTGAGVIDLNLHGYLTQNILVEELKQAKSRVITVSEFDGV